jgi:hypothetical protein
MSVAASLREIAWPTCPLAIFEGAVCAAETHTVHPSDGGDGGFGTADLTVAPASSRAAHVGGLQTQIPLRASSL